MEFIITMANNSVFSKRGVRRLIKNHTDKRVSEDAVLEAIEALEAYGQELTEVAHGYADHADRKTIKAEDVRKALYH